MISYVPQNRSCIVLALAQFIKDLRIHGIADSVEAMFVFVV
jgi:hypothetical protein